jgi:diguanylate cyclase (GGDEF)-like protein
MSFTERIVGVAEVDERPFAGRITGWAMVSGALGTLLLPLLPGVHGTVLGAALPAIVLAMLWGVLCLTVVDWRRLPGWATHASAVGSLVMSAVVAHETGGADSPVRLFAIVVVGFAAYFFPAREAWPYVGLGTLLLALPFAYDPGAVEAGTVGELVLVGPSYGLLTFFLISGKRRMLALRDRADRLARTDELTGLANRRALIEALNGAGGRARDERVGLLMLDVDDFKDVNTLYGHAGGDRALIFLASCLRTSCRSGDVPARLGGDEFAVLVPSADEAGMEALAARLLDAVRVGNVVSVSAGWALGGLDLLKDADAALGEAKRAGKDRALSAVAARS